MREYTIIRKPEEFSWDKVPYLYVDNQQWVPELPIHMQAQICYDDEALYAAYPTGSNGSPYPCRRNRPNWRSL